jgi:YD repeat-containing protein
MRLLLQHVARVHSALAHACQKDSILLPDHKLRRCALGLCLIVSVFLVVSPVAHAQITNVTADQATPTPGVGHDYIRMLSETVDPSTGSLSLRISVPMPQGRGLTLPFAFSYDSNGVHIPRPSVFTQIAWESSLGFMSQGGWSYAAPLLSHGTGFTNDHINGICDWTTNYMFQSPSGGRHALNLGTARDRVQGSGACGGYGKVNVLSGGDAFYSATPSVVADRDGTVFQYSGSNAKVFPGSTEYLLPSVVKDRNGNKVVITDLGSGAFTFTDTLNRTVLNSNGFGTTGNTVTVSGFPNPYIITWGTANSNFSVGILAQPTPPRCASAFGPDVETQPVIRSIALPNGQQYTLKYDSDDPSIAHPFGLLAQIVYPSGGWVKYTWTLNQLATSGLFKDSNNSPGCEIAYDIPAVATRTVSFDGTTPALVQTFNYSTALRPGNVTWVNKQTTVTTQDVPRGGTFETDYTYVPVNIGNPPNDAGPCILGLCQVPVENTITYKDWNAATLKTVTKVWQNQYLLTDETTQLGSGSGTPTSDVHYTYYPAAQGFQLQEKDEYDYGSGARGALLRKTNTNYQAFSASPLFPSGPSIFDRPCQVIAYDGSGTNRAAETDYLYDGATTLCALISSAVPTGGPSNYSGHDGGTHFGTTATTPRGNLTTKTHKCFQGATACSDALTTYTYDETGQILSAKDADGNTTQFSYADSYTDQAAPQPTDAYLTQVTRPITNGVSHIEKFSYAYSYGQLTLSTDENNLQTQYLYNEPLRRLTETDYLFDGGQTTIAYNDTARTVTTSKKINAAQSLTTVAVSDGIGHVKQTQLTSDPQTSVFTDTSYDGLGRVRTVSNPYRSGADPTTSAGITTYAYDALGRKTSESYPDGSVLTTAYCGSSTLVTDPAGKWRRSRTDGLGRLVEVDEPNAVGATVAASGCPGTGEPIWVTSYSFDALGNMTNVVQNGSHQRGFGYDSLSRLRPGPTRVCVATTSRGHELCDANHLLTTCCGRDTQKLSTHTDSTPSRAGCNARALLF